MMKIEKFIKKKNKTKIVSLSAYSKNIASILDNYCDLILVGDSLGSVLYNYKSTQEVTLNTMIEHSKSVRQGVKKSLMVVDMPYNTYRTPKEALKKAKEHKCVTILNPAPARKIDEDNFKLIDFFTPNETEAEFYLNKNIKTDTDIKNAANEFLKKGIKNV